MGLTALAASIAPAPRRDSPTPPPASPAPPSAVEEASLTFRAPAAKGARARRHVEPGTHVLVVVAARRPGQADIPRLGLTGTVTAHAPALFDLVAPDEGRYRVVFTPTAGSPARVGTLVSRAARQR
jgi:hypothetical protein